MGQSRTVHDRPYQYLNNVDFRSQRRRDDEPTTFLIPLKKDEYFNWRGRLKGGRFKQFTARKKYSHRIVIPHNIIVVDNAFDLMIEIGKPWSFELAYGFEENIGYYSEAVLYFKNQEDALMLRMKLG